MKSNTPSLKENFTGLKTFIADMGSEKFPRAIVIASEEPYLAEKSLQSLTEAWQKTTDSNAEVLEASEVNIEDLKNRLLQEDLFAESSFMVIRRAKANKALMAFLGTKVKIQDKMTLCIDIGDKVPAAINKNAEFKILNFGKLQVDEILFLAKGIAQKSKLQFEPGVLETIIQANGDDLHSLDNELGKLALVFHDQERAISSADITPYLQVLREDHIFALTNYLLDGQAAKAVQLATELIRRGEAGVLVLSVLARHYRNALAIKTASQSGVSSWDLGRQLRLPNHVLKRYTDYTRTRPANGFVRALDECRKVDHQMKVSRNHWEVALTAVITAQG